MADATLLAEMREEMGAIQQLKNPWVTSSTVTKLPPLKLLDLAFDTMANGRLQRRWQKWQLRLEGA
ncbi:putative myosin light chain kinase, smooth muscle-like isoform [Sesbania bispinosa]|nr:putative myosin light chain kinase, smooth muscle-like isoform [Sesbania bispinosa]